MAKIFKILFMLVTGFLSLTACNFSARKNHAIINSKKPKYFITIDSCNWHTTATKKDMFYTGNIYCFIKGKTNFKNNYITCLGTGLKNLVQILTDSNGNFAQTFLYSNSFSMHALPSNIFTCNTLIYSANYIAPILDTISAEKIYQNDSLHVLQTNIESKNLHY